MLCLDLTVTLTVTLTIMIGALVLNQQGSAAEEVPRVRAPDSGGQGGQGTQLGAAHRGLPRHPDDPLRQREGRLFWRGNRRHGLDKVALKLKNVIDKYEVKEGELRALYEGVVACGVDKCGKFRDAIPENQLLRGFECVRRHRHFNRRVLTLLSDFHAGVQKIKKYFRVLLCFEKSSLWKDPKRRRLLKELKSDIKLLKIEIEAVISGKRQHKTVRRSPVTACSFPPPNSHTDLKIYEWRIIQDSKKFLRQWKKNLNRVIRCINSEVLIEEEYRQEDQRGN